MNIYYFIPPGQNTRGHNSQRKPFSLSPRSEDAESFMSIWILQIVMTVIVITKDEVLWKFNPEYTSNEEAVVSQWLYFTFRGHVDQML